MQLRKGPRENFMMIAFWETFKESSTSLRLFVVIGALKKQNL